MTGYAQGTSAAKILKLENKVEQAVGKLTGDVDLFSEGGNDT